MVAGQSVHLQDEVILEEEEAHDGEEVDEDEGQQGGQQDGAAIAGHALDDVEQSLLPVNEVEELQGRDGAEGLRWARGLQLPVLPTASPPGTVLGQASPRGLEASWRLWTSKSKERGAEGQAVHTQGDGALAL